MNNRPNAVSCPFTARVEKIRYDKVNGAQNGRYVVLTASMPSTPAIPFSWGGGQKPFSLTSENVPMKAILPIEGEWITVTHGTPEQHPKHGWQFVRCRWKKTVTPETHTGPTKLQPEEIKRMLNNGLKKYITTHLIRDLANVSPYSIGRLHDMYQVDFFESFTNERDRPARSGNVLKGQENTVRNLLNEALRPDSKCTTREKVAEMKLACLMQDIGLSFKTVRHREQPSKTGPVSVERKLHDQDVDVGMDDEDDERDLYIPSKEASMVLANPYLLILRFRRDYAKVERLVSAMNADRKDSDVAAAVFILQRNEKSGHTSLTIPQFEREFSALVGVPVDIAKVTRAVKISSEKSQSFVTISRPGFLSLSETFAKERAIARAVMDKLKRKPHEFEKERGRECFAGNPNSREQPPWHENELQLRALQQAVTNRISIISGGPGTGKSTVIFAIIQYFLMKGVCVHVCAPTGKAAQRLSKGRRCRTIHSLLQAPWYVKHAWQEEDKESELDESAYARFAPRRSVCPDSVEHCMGSDRKMFSSEKLHAVIVDEFSMVNLDSAHRLFMSFPANTFFVIVGDKYQLPAIGCGDVLEDILTAIPVTMLNRAYRQDAASAGIMTMADAIREQRLSKPESFSGVTVYNVKHFSKSSPNSNSAADPDAKHILDVLKFLFKQEFDYNGKDWKTTLQNFQILVPRWDGHVGLHEVNRFLREQWNGNTKQAARGTITERFLPKAGKSLSKDRRDYEPLTLYVGDKVLMLKNDPTREVYNGMTGIVLSNDSLNPLGAPVTKIAWFDGPLISYPPDDPFLLNKVTLGYCVSVHRAQGSESAATAFVSSKEYGRMQTKRLAYTAVTRAKSRLYLVMDSWDSFLEAVSREDPARNTVLRHLF